MKFPRRRNCTKTQVPAETQASCVGFKTNHNKQADDTTTDMNQDATG